MHLIFRTLLLLLTARRRRPKLDLFETSSLPMRVLPTDLEYATHDTNAMNNTLKHLDRNDMMDRTG